MKNYIFILEIILVSILIPWGINVQNIAIIFIVLIILCYHIFKSKKGYTILFLTIMLCIPSTEDKNLGARFSYLFHIIRFGILLTFIFQLKYLKYRNHIITSNLKFVIFLVILINILYSFAFDSFPFLLNSCLYYPIITYIFMWIAFNDRMNLNISKNSLDILFAVFAVYVILEFFFNISPYHFLYENDLSSIDVIRRAKGLLGHPLIVSCVVLLYESFLLYRLTQKEKIKLQIILCLIIGIITVSRTTYILGILEILLWIILNRKYKSFTFYFYFFIFIILFYFLATDIMSDYFTDVIYRFQNDNIDQRYGAYYIVEQLISSHPLGCGPNFMETIRMERLNNIYFTNTFNTLDNYFLTQIAIYGYLAILIYIYDFYYMFIICFHTKKYSKIIPAILLLFFTRILMSFTFDIQAYLSFNMIYYYILAYIIKNETLNINTNNIYNGK